MGFKVWDLGPRVYGYEGATVGGGNQASEVLGDAFLNAKPYCLSTTPTQ